MKKKENSSYKIDCVCFRKYKIFWNAPTLSDLGIGSQFPDGNVEEQATLDVFKCYLMDEIGFLFDD